MVRSFTARLGRPLFAPAPRRRSGLQGGRTGRGDRSTTDLLWRPFEAIAGLARSGFQAISRHRRLRIALLALLVALPLLAGGWLLLRKSSFVRVEHVKVSGVHGPQAHAIDAALAGAAEHMSTLDLHTAALRAAVASFPVVQSVKAVPSFPHGLRIEVTEQLPVAALSIGGTRTAVAADGVVLGPALLSSSLPALAAQQGAATEIGGQAGGRVQSSSLLAELTVLGAAPKPIARDVKRVYSSSGGQGLTVAMRSGLLVYFGDASRPHAKWTALARVLADPTSAGASYIDVRVPERPAAGFSSASAPSESTTSTAGQASTPESTVAALAAGLTNDTNGEPAAAASTPSTTEASTEPEATSEATSGAVPEAESSAGSEDPASTGESEPTAESATPGG
jgi:cell division protein FtsQ